MLLCFRLNGAIKRQIHSGDQLDGQQKGSIADHSETRDYILIIHRMISKLALMTFSLVTSTSVLATQYICEVNSVTFVSYTGDTAALEVGGVFVVDLEREMFRAMSEPDFKGSCEGAVNFADTVKCIYAPERGVELETLIMEGLPSLRFTHFFNLLAGSFVRNGECTEL
jgi:hypothetical protein